MPALTLTLKLLVVNNGKVARKLMHQVKERETLKNERIRYPERLETIKPVSSRPNNKTVKHSGIKKTFSFYKTVPRVSCFVVLTGDIKHRHKMFWYKFA